MTFRSRFSDAGKKAEYREWRNDWDRSAIVIRRRATGCVCLRTSRPQFNEETGIVNSKEVIYFDFLKYLLSSSRSCSRARESRDLTATSFRSRISAVSPLV